MDCKVANTLMMRYMDSVITETEAKTLNAHIISCSACKEDFMLYEYMAGEFEAQRLELFEPPSDFELRVMKSVCLIEPDYCRPCSQDTVVGFVFGAFSMLFGAGVIVSMYRAEIAELFAGYPYIVSIMNGASRSSDAAFTFVNAAADKCVFYLNGAFSLLEGAKYGILAVVAALITVQFFIYTKNKVEA